MKKILYTLALVAIAAIPANAQKFDPTKPGTATTIEDDQKVVNGPKIQFEKNVHDYGQIAAGANGDCEFKFKNVGTEPLVLTNVQPSCGCTTPQWPRDPVLPGAEATIKVHYDTKRLGNIGKSVTVYSNSVEGADRIVLRISGNVNPQQN